MHFRRSRFASRFTFALAGFLLAPMMAHAVQVVSGPTLTMDPNGQTPLAGVVEFETDTPVRAKLTITDGIDVQRVDFPDPVQVHYLPVLGLKPDRTYTVDIRIVPGGPIGSLMATTDPLPADFPTLITNVSDPQAMEPGYTFIDCLRRERTDPRPTWSAIVDSAGEVVWYSTRCPTATRQLPTGKIFYRGGGAAGDTAIEMDLLANDTRVQLQVPGNGLHHDLLRTPHGTYLSLTRRSVDVDEFPTSDTDPLAPLAPATLEDDSVVEFLPDGTLRREWALTDMLDITRIGYDSLNPRPAGLDWTHSNAVNYRLEDDSIIVSVRHQDAVIKFSRETGELTWILGPHDNWSPAFQQYLLSPVNAPFGWQFHQHAPMWTENGTLVLFDNGNHRASPFDGTVPLPAEQSFSRGVEFEIDEGLMQVQQLWEYGESIGPQIYSFFISDADWQPVTGNRVITFGGVSYVGGVSGLDLGFGVTHTRIIEVTNETVPVKVFELIAYDPTGGRISVYRSERIPSLYPPENVKAPNGVGNTLMVEMNAGSPEASWNVSPVDSEHSAADYYVVYVSSLPDGGFTILDSTMHSNLEASGSAVFYKVVAANSAGTSGDEPSP